MKLTINHKSHATQPFKGWRGEGLGFHPAFTMLISRDLNDLEASIKMKAVSFLNKCEQAGLDILITCTVRDNEAQDWLYASGRTRKGDILTNAKAGQSQHNFKKAFDFCVMTAGKCDWNNTAAFKKAGLIAESCGLSWAGRWTGKIKELGHCEVK